MAKRDDEWGPWLGYRYDVDLNQRWRHRLFKVAYSVLFSLVLAFFAFLAYEATPERKVDNIKINGRLRLDEFLAKTDPSVPNVIPAFMLLPGDNGLLKANGELDYLFSFNLEKSWCTPDAIRHLQATTKHLTERAYVRPKGSDVRRSEQHQEGQSS